jgi:hypothetical protein
MNFPRRWPALALALLANPLLGFAPPPSAWPQLEAPVPPTQGTKDPAPKQPAAKTLSETEELQRAIDRAGNDRAALVRNLEDFLKEYPESHQRPQI